MVSGSLTKQLLSLPVASLGVEGHTWRRKPRSRLFPHGSSWVLDIQTRSRRGTVGTRATSDPRLLSLALRTSKRDCEPWGQQVSKIIPMGSPSIRRQPQSALHPDSVSTFRHGCTKQLPCSAHPNRALSGCKAVSSYSACAASPAGLRVSHFWGSAQTL